MKKGTITLLVVLAICAVCIVTCPDKQKHQDALITLLRTAPDKVIDESDDDLLSVLSSLLKPELAKYTIENNMLYENKFLYSLGKLESDGELKTVSFGILGHVFTGGLNEDAF